MIKDEIKKGLVFKTYDDLHKGGQHVGLGPPEITLSHSDFEFSITCGEFRSRQENKDFCLTVFELLLMELKIK